jgi:hypothetical protein
LFQQTEDRRQKAEDRRQMTDVRSRKTGVDWERERGGDGVMSQSKFDNLPIRQWSNERIKK